MKGNCFIGVTGGIGSGKSRVSRFWSAYAGWPLVDIDLLCRDLLEVGKPGWVALREALGERFFCPDGNLDRPCLRSAIFADDALRHQVDAIMHPLARDLLLGKAERMEGPVLVDVPLLFEAGWLDLFRRTVVVYAGPQTCCRRVSSRDRVSTGETLKAIAAQMDMDTKAMLADHVVDNRYCWLLTRAQVVHLAELLCAHFSDEEYAAGKGHRRSD